MYENVFAMLSKSKSDRGNIAKMFVEKHPMPTALCSRTMYITVE
jgi:hypothetical protein